MHEIMGSMRKTLEYLAKDAVAGDVRKRASGLLEQLKSLETAVTAMEEELKKAKA